MHRPRLFGALLFAVAVSASACQPGWTSSGANPTPCYVGSFTLTGEQIASAVSSLGLPVTVTPLAGGSGVVFTTTSGGQWSLTADQSFSVSGGSLISGTAAVTASASGTYTATSTTITFALSSLSGQAAFNGTYNGQPASLTVPLSTVGVDELYGFDGTATFTCGANGPQLTFPRFSEDF